MKGPTIALLSFFAGLATGGLAMIFVRSPMDTVGESEVTPPGITSSINTAKLPNRTTIASPQPQLEAELEILRRENEALTSQLKALQEEQAEAEASRNQWRQNATRMRSLFEQRVEAQHQARIAYDREFFNLTPYQESRLNEWVRAQGELMQSRQELMQQLRDGQITREDAQRQIRELEAGSVAYEDALRTVLTGEQLAEFEDYEAQLDHNRREARAYEQLGELARSLVLSEEQKDALLEVFYLQEPPSGLRELPSEERRQAWRQFQESELQKLQAILTPEQLELYQTRWRRGRD